MKITLIILAVFLSLSVSAQRVRYLDINMRVLDVDKKEQAVFYTETTYKDRTALVGTVKTFFMDGTPFSEVNYSSLFAKRREGLTTLYYPNGAIKTEISFKNDLFDGPLKTYYPNQRLKRAELYEKGNFIQGKCFTPTGKDTAHYAFQTDPKFPGGRAALEKYIRANLEKGFYQKPEPSPRATGYFMVNTAGRPYAIVVDGDCKKEQLEAVVKLIATMPDWVPGTDDGILVDKPARLPISFSL